GVIVPGHLFAERAAQALQRAAFELIPHAVGVRDRAAVLRDDETLRVDASARLIDGDLGDHRDVAVVAFIEDARGAAAGRDTRSRRVRSRRRPRLPPGRLRRRREDRLYAR